MIENNKTLPGGVESCAFFQPFLANVAFGEDSEEFEFTKITDHMIETPGAELSQLKLKTKPYRYMRSDSIYHLAKWECWH